MSRLVDQIVALSMQPKPQQQQLPPELLAIDRGHHLWNDPKDDPQRGLGQMLAGALKGGADDLIQGGTFGGGMVTAPLELKQNIEGALTQQLADVEQENPWMQAQSGQDQVAQILGMIGAPDAGDASDITRMIAGQMRRGTRAAQRGLSPLAGTIAERAAWHGGPHKFASLPDAPHGKVDLSKVGTGEGAQAYGWGFYAAEKQGTAKSYQSALANQKYIEVDGKPLRPIPQSVDGLAQDAITTTGYDEGIPNFDEAKAFAQDYSNNALSPENKQIWLDAKKRIGELEMQDVSIAGGGHLYELDIPDESIDKMLDWDKPLSDAPKEVQGIFADIERETIEPILAQRRQSLELARKEGRDTTRLERQVTLLEEEVKNPAIGTPSGENYYQFLATKLGGQKEASEYLKARGIPGIKYLDEGSRSAGEGTRNFVLFDEDTAKVIGVE